MNKNFYSHIDTKIQELKDGGTYKTERVISSAQDPVIKLEKWSDSDKLLCE